MCHSKDSRNPLLSSLTSVESSTSAQSSTRRSKDIAAGEFLIFLFSFLLPPFISFPVRSPTNYLNKLKRNTIALNNTIHLPFQPTKKKKKKDKTLASCRRRFPPVVERRVSPDTVIGRHCRSTEQINRAAPPSAPIHSALLRSRPLHRSRTASRPNQEAVPRLITHNPTRSRLLRPQVVAEHRVPPVRRRPSWKRNPRAQLRASWIDPHRPSRPEPLFSAPHHACPRRSRAALLRAAPHLSASCPSRLQFSSRANSSFQVEPTPALKPSRFQLSSRVDSSLQAEPIPAFLVEPIRLSLSRQPAPEHLGPIDLERWISSARAQALQPRPRVSCLNYIFGSWVIWRVNHENWRIKHLGPRCLENTFFWLLGLVEQISRVVSAWVSFGITTYLGLRSPTGRQSSMDIDMIRVIRREPHSPIVLVFPLGSLQTSRGRGNGKDKLVSDQK
uniref:Uncharacterized protein n=1 Tax=Cucumis melo TaxID=3656 RepID=A0A9I9E508_CUCME